MRWSYQLLPEHPLDELLGTLSFLTTWDSGPVTPRTRRTTRICGRSLQPAQPRTSRLRLGPEVAGISIKDPSFVAQQIATLDELTGGRAELVFSTGNFAIHADGDDPAHHRVLQDLCADPAHDQGRAGPRDDGAVLLHLPARSAVVRNGLRQRGCRGVVRRRAHADRGAVVLRRWWVFEGD